jgi:tmRNA-binding protein
MSIADNKKAFHDYFIEERFEAGVARPATAGFPEKAGAA